MMVDWWLVDGLYWWLMMLNEDSLMDTKLVNDDNGELRGVDDG